MKNIRIMRMTGWTICMLITTNLLAQSSSQNPSSEQLTVALSSPGKPYTLNMGVVAGSIRVIGYAGKEIVIDVSSREKNRKDMTEDAGNGLRKVSPRNSFEVTAKEVNNVVTIENNQPSKSVDFILKIPSDAKLKLSTVNSGDIEVENVKGELEVNNVNGSIKLSNISGSAVATTVNGSVKASFLAVDPKAPMAFTTLNGDVDVTYPATSKSSFRVKSEKGDVFTEFEIKFQKKDIKLDDPGNESSKPGEHIVKLKLDEWIYFEINGGGPENLLKTLNGNIYIRKAK